MANTWWYNIVAVKPVNLPFKLPFSLSLIQLALTGAPASSHIYVFTDALAKDIALKDTIVALIRSTKSTVESPAASPRP